jgi:hypothetical protein
LIFIFFLLVTALSPLDYLFVAENIIGICYIAKIFIGQLSRKLKHPGPTLPAPVFVFPTDHTDLIDYTDLYIHHPALDRHSGRRCFSSGDPESRLGRRLLLDSGSSPE